MVGESKRELTYGIVEQFQNPKNITHHIFGEIREGIASIKTEKDIKQQITRNQEQVSES